MITTNPMRLDFYGSTNDWRQGLEHHASWTELIDPKSLKGQLPPNMTLGMLEMNIGLQWGMNAFRYRPQKTALARRLTALDTNKVRQAARKHLAGANAPWP